MCTVTYLPNPDNSYLLTSNRDESSLRPTGPPEIQNHPNGKYLFPKDELAGGTGIAVADKGRFGNVLNGAFEKHKWEPPYKKSRGLIMLEMLISEDQKEYLKSNDLTGVEPFTFIFGSSGSLFEMQWDGLNHYHKELDPNVPHIWSSAQLYPAKVRDKRAQWFEAWLRNKKEYKLEEILNFHEHGGEGDAENDLVMNRYNMVQTVSITSLIGRPDSFRMIYKDLVKDLTTDAVLVI